MSVDKLVDSTQLDSDLTSVANAIRTKGGTSASLSFPSGFVDAIDAISGGGTPSSITLDSDCITLRAAIVTVGTNSVSNSTQVMPYLLGLADFPTSDYQAICYSVVDNSSYTLNNMAVCEDITERFDINASGNAKFYRYRNNAISKTSYGVSYDAKLKSGDKYLVATMYWKGAPTV